MVKKVVFLLFALSLVICGCSPNTQNSATRFMMDTVITISANVDNRVLNEAFQICSQYEKRLSAHIEDSEISRLSKGENCISPDIAGLISRALYYSKITDGRFDITVLPLCRIWDFNNKTVPSDDAIELAKKSVDYKKVSVSDNIVSAGGAEIDLGAVAKGFVADRIREYLESCGVEDAVINLGGNLVLMGTDYKVVGIKKPFSQENAAYLKVKNTSVVTSGIYERYFEVDGKIYHHIIDALTGRPSESDLASVTVICESSQEADALSTVCLLLGLSEAKQLIDRTDGAQALFITRDGRIETSSGIYFEDGYYRN